MNILTIIKWGQDLNPRMGIFFNGNAACRFLPWPNFRIFGQLKKRVGRWEGWGPRPTDRDKFDAHQAFMDVSTGIGDSRYITLRAGRQEMDMGRPASFQSGRAPTSAKALMG